MFGGWNKVRKYLDPPISRDLFICNHLIEEGMTDIYHAFNFSQSKQKHCDTFGRFCFEFVVNVCEINACPKTAKLRDNYMKIAFFNASVFFFRNREEKNNSANHRENQERHEGESIIISFRGLLWLFGNSTESENKKSSNRFSRAWFHPLSQWSKTSPQRMFYVAPVGTLKKIIIKMDHRRFVIVI